MSSGALDYLNFFLEPIPAIENTVERMFWFKNVHFSSSLRPDLLLQWKSWRWFFWFPSFVPQISRLVLELQNIMSERLHKKSSKPTLDNNFLYFCYKIDVVVGVVINKYRNISLLISLLLGTWTESCLLETLFCLLRCTLNALSAQLLQGIYQI